MARQTLLDALRNLQPDATEMELLGWILRGSVLVNERRVTSPSSPVGDIDEVRLSPVRRYVSRGGEKLAAALDEWTIDVSGLVILDAGCSSGGFTDCLLQRRARRVYCVDVGYNLLSYPLRIHPATVLLEKTNVMDLSRERLDDAPDGAVCDLSFRSLRGAAAHLLDLLSGDWVVALAKPQFEWLDPPARFRGVVTERDDLGRILLELFRDLEDEGVYPRRCLRSPIKGRRGNAEFLLLLSRRPDNSGTARRELEVALSE